MVIKNSLSFNDWKIRFMSSVRFRFITVNIIFLICAPFTSLWAQEFSYQNYSIPQGLVQTQVSIIYEDSKGYLWIGTKGGVSIFDGYEFKNLTVNDGLLSPFVKQIIEDKSGRMWFLHQRGVSYLENGLITSFNCIPVQFGSIGLFESCDGEVCLITRNDASDEIKEFCFSRNQFIESSSYSDILNEYQQTIDPYKNRRGFNVLYNPSDCELWVLFFNGSLISIKNDEIVEEIKDYPLHSIFLSRTNEIYLTDTFTFYKISNSTIQPLHHLTENMFYPDRSFIAISDSEFYFFDFNWRLHYFKTGNLFNDNYKFPNGCFLFLSRNNSLWLGSDGHGIYKLKSTAFTNFLPEKNQSVPNVWSILEDKHHRVWFSSYTDGLGYVSENGFESDNTYLELPGLIEPNMYMGGGYHPDGDILFTHIQFGLIRFDSEKFSAFYSTPPVSSAFIMVDDTFRKKIVCGTNIGLLQSDYQGNSYFDTLFIGKTKNVVSITIDTSGIYWLGTFSGFSRYNPDTKELLSIPNYPENLGAISQCRDQFGNLWIGNDHGLHVYATDSLYHIAPHVFPSFVNDLKIYGNDTLLIGAINGFGMLDVAGWNKSKAENISFFNSDNGFDGIECGQNGMLVDSHNKVWIPTSDRVVCFDPALLKAEKQPGLFIESVQITDKEGNARFHKPNDGFTLRGDDREIKIKLLATGINDISNLKYKSFLVDEDGHEMFTSDERIFTIAGLQPGEYTMKSIANIQSISPIEGKLEFHFSVIPVYYQTLWFWFSLGILVLFGAVFITVKISATQKNKQIQKMENEKYIHELQLKTLLGQLNPHFIFNTINSIGSAIYSENKEKAYTILQRFSKLIRFSLVSSDILVHPLEQELDLLTDYLEIEKSRFSEKFDYQISVEENVDKNIHIPKLVLQNFAENALKHGLLPGEHKGMLQINLRHGSDTMLRQGSDTLLRQGSDTLNITIEDNGIGREAASKLDKQSTGKGMSVILDSIYLYNQNNDRKIVIEVIDIFDDQHLAKGTKVGISIPVTYTYST